MGKLKLLTIPILLSLLLIPLSVSFAQEEEILPEDDPRIYESGPAEETPVLYDTEYDYTTTTTTTTTPLSDEAIAAIASLSIGFFVFMGALCIGSYVFFAIALSKIGKEMNYENSWFAWVPILNYVMVFKLGDQNPLLLLLLLIPGIGEVVIAILATIALMRLTEKRGYDKALALIILTGIGAYILFYLIAWKPKTAQLESDVMAQAPVQPMMTETTTPLPQAPMETPPTPPLTQ